MNITIKDKDQLLLNNIVVELIPSQHTQLPEQTLATATMKQIDQQFIPHVLAVAKGTKVGFPDTDTVRHHVYSFSQAKTFEILIDQQSVPRDIVFEQAGTVELGCNIHDWMLGYIYIADSNLFTQTDANGHASFKHLEKGAYQVKIWHPRLSEDDTKTSRSIAVNDKSIALDIVLEHDLVPSYAEFDDVHGLSEYE